MNIAVGTRQSKLSMVIRAQKDAAPSFSAATGRATDRLYRTQRTLIMIKVIAGAAQGAGPNEPASFRGSLRAECRSTRPRCRYCRHELGLTAPLLRGA